MLRSATGDTLGLAVAVSNESGVVDWELKDSAQALLDKLARSMEKALGSAANTIGLSFDKVQGLSFQLFNAYEVDESYSQSVDVGKELFSALGVADVSDILDLQASAQLQIVGDVLVALGFTYDFSKGATDRLTVIDYDKDSEVGTGIQLDLETLGINDLEVSSVLSVPQSYIDTLPKAIQKALAGIQIDFGIHNGSLSFISDSSKPFAQIVKVGSGYNSTLNAALSLQLPFMLGGQLVAEFEVTALTINYNSVSGFAFDIDTSSDYIQTLKDQIPTFDDIVDDALIPLILNGIPRDLVRCYFSSH